MFISTNYNNIFILKHAVFLRNVAGDSVNRIVAVESNTTTVIECGINAHYPQWSGPPVQSSGTNTLYNYETSSKFNPNLDQNKLSRMSWADNQRDLTFSPVTRDEDGVYECFSNLSWKVQINVRGIDVFYIVFPLQLGA